jgi:hypothetical protein
LAVPLIQQLRVGAYIMKQRLRGNDRYPLVLMLEPLFRCNLACPGCGKIDYPEDESSIAACRSPSASRRPRRAARPSSPSPAASR